MRIYVCVKRVADTTGPVAINPDGTMNRNKMTTIPNPEDLNALEAALTLKEKYGATVTTVTMGPAAAGIVLRELMAMGADETVLSSAREFGGSDTYGTSQIVAASIAHLGLEKGDIVLCGHQAIDGDTAQVGPEMAEKLGIPQVTCAIAIEKTGDTVTVTRALENETMTIEVETPCLISCMKELNTPRYMSVQGVFEADDREIKVLTFDDIKNELEADMIGLKGAPTNIARTFSPPVRGQGEMLKGSNKDMAQALAQKLAAKHII